MTPISGKVGTKVTLNIVSSSFSLEGDYELRWSPTATFDENKTKILKRGTAPNGVHAVAVIFRVPESRYGVNYVQFAPLRDIEPINIQIIVEPNLEAIPELTKPGEMVTIKGTGFPANDRGTLFFNNKATNTIATTSINGSFEIRFIVPTASSGKHKLHIDIPITNPEAGTTTIQVITQEL